jgi:hypothetical protein
MLKRTGGGAIASSGIGYIGPSVSSTNAAAKGNDLLRAFQEFHKRHWGVPLAACMTMLPDEAVSAMDVTPTKENGSNEKFGIYGSEDATEERITPPDLLPEPQFVETGTIFDGPGRFFLRADYIRIYNYLKEIYDNYMEEREVKPPVAVVTGQPGIGASTVDCTTFSS